MEKVVYILGAGFSAPLGIPVMTNFLYKSKDLYASDPDKYHHFKTVFDTINEMSVTKNYFESDLHNIEEILSVLEMARSLEGIHKRDLFVRYICDVITHHTPLLNLPTTFPSNWDTALFTGYQHAVLYGFFVSSLFGLQVNEGDGLKVGAFKCRPMSNVNVQYDIVTLNYDTVLEGIIHHLGRMCKMESPIAFVRPRDSAQRAQGVHAASIAKLHGSVDTNSIVPPTWNKGLAEDAIHPEWTLAFKSIQEANHIRIIGYSLPESDAYVRYLLKSAVAKSENLKSIDVLCLDDRDGTVKRKFDDFIRFRDYRFLSKNVIEYLKSHHSIHQRVDFQNRVIRFDCLERAHEKFFRSS